MTRTEVKPAISAVKDLMALEPDALREIVRSVMQTMLEAEMDETRARASAMTRGSAIARAITREHW